MPDHSTPPSATTATDNDSPLLAVTITIHRIHLAVLSIALTAALVLLAGNSVAALLAAAACVAVAAGSELRIALQSTARSERRPALLTLLLAWMPGGIALAAFSWITMAIIVAILGFMMDPGNWLTDRTLFAGVVNPIYLPQLAFRTPLAMAMAGVVAAVLVVLFTRREPEFRGEALRAVNLWALFWVSLTFAGGWRYASVVPETMRDNLATGLLTMQFEEWKTAPASSGLACPGPPPHDGASLS